MFTMKIVPQNVVLMLSFAAYNYFCFAKDNIKLGVYFSKDQENTELNWNVIIEDNVIEDVEFTSPDITIVSDKDILDASEKLCSLSSQGDGRVVGVFGPSDVQVSSTLESICFHLGLPYLLTTWQPEVENSPINVINLYPDTVLLSKGLAKIVESFDWEGFVILFEDDQGLLKLQEVLKLQQYKNSDTKNSVSLIRLDSNWDNRHILKTIRNSSINRIILDCHVDRIMDILNQAQDLKLLADFSTSFFLTSLDAHTLDYSSLKILSNITTVRLFDPHSSNFQKVADEYFPLKQPNQIKVHEAIMHDAMRLLATMINDLKSQQNEISEQILFCNNTENYEDDINIIDAIKKINIPDALSGPLTLQNGRREKFALEVIETDKPDKPIAIWNSEFPTKIHLTRNSTEREAELQKRMESYNFIVTSRLGPPYLMIDNAEAYGNARYKGYSMDLIKEIAKLINITFEFRITEDNSYLNLVNDLVERKADLGICDFTITPIRREQIDFSMPFMNLGIGILHKEAGEEEMDNMYAFMRPISWTVWFYIWTLNLLISITMFFVARMAPGEWENPKPWDPKSKELENIWTIKNFLWLTLGSITTQGCDILPKSVPTRVISGAWWVFSLIITSSYTANLAAFLTMSKKDVTVDNVEELAAQSKIKYGLVAKASTESFFANSNNSLYQKMWNTMKNERPSVFEKDNTNGVERVNSTKNGLYAFFMESTGIEYELERKCDLRKIGDLLDSKSYGIGMPLNADYRHSINNAVLHLQESGRLLGLKEKWWKIEREGEPCVRDTGEKTDALALANVGGIFVVLGVGIGLAYFIAFMDFFWHVRRISVEEHLSYLEALKCEIKFACKILQRKKRARPVPSESSSSKSDFEPEKVTMARSLFSKSISLLNMNTQVNNELRERNISKASRSPENTLRVS